MDKNTCEHKMWRRTGLWDGKNMTTGEPTGGPMIMCVDCGLTKNVTYPEWGQIKEDGKAEIKKLN